MIGFVTWPPIKDDKGGIYILAIHCNWMRVCNFCLGTTLYKLLAFYDTIINQVHGVIKK